MSDDAWLILVFASDGLLGVLVLWHVWGPLQPSRRRTITFSIGTLVAVPVLCAAVVGWLSTGA